jgi:hypothetical protein
VFLLHNLQCSHRYGHPGILRVLQAAHLFNLQGSQPVCPHHNHRKHLKNSLCRQLVFRLLNRAVTRHFSRQCSHRVDLQVTQQLDHSALLHYQAPFPRLLLLLCPALIRLRILPLSRVRNLRMPPLTPLSLQPLLRRQCHHFCQPRLRLSIAFTPILRVHPRTVLR